MDSNVFVRQQVDPDLCKKYAQFASHLVRWQFKIIYWVMFITNLFVLFLASWTYTRGQDTLTQHTENSPKRKKRLRQCIFLCLGCVCVSTVIVIMEAYAIMALQFCDGEDLISLYWSTWTMIQVGSLIAMVGIILALLNSLENRRHPPWALALGTPVLVIAGVLHLLHGCTTRRIKKTMRSRKEGTDDATGPPMSQANTIRVDTDDEGDEEEEFEAEVVGFAIDGGPIVRFINAVPDPLPNHMQILGYSADNRPIAICTREGVQLMTTTTGQSLPPTTEAPPKGS